MHSKLNKIYLVVNYFFKVQIMHKKTLHREEFNNILKQEFNQCDYTSDHIRFYIFP